MQYLGGKTRIARHLAEQIDKVRRPGQLVWDPFCGGLSMTKALAKKGPVMSTDASAPLIYMYKAFRSGWRPPLPVTRSDWELAKTLPDSDPMKGFLGFGCSFCGIYFQGFGKEVPGKYEHVYASRTLARDTLVPAAIELENFLTSEPVREDMVLYLDPPYVGAAGYSGAPPFDFAIFRERVVAWAEYCHVFVSEYQFPLGREVWSGSVPITVSGGGQKGALKTERLYYIGPKKDGHSC